MKKPKKLVEGDQVAIVATGKKIQFQDIKKSIHVFEEWGLKVKVGKTIDSECNYLAGTDELRSQDLQNMINDPEIKAIFFARGGYGTVRIIDNIDFSPLAKNPKWLIGFSDVTVLHSHVYSDIQLPTIHGIMPVFFNDATESSIASCKKVLFEGEMNYNFQNSPTDIAIEGECSGLLFGGNLSILYSLCGSSSFSVPENGILFIEDLCEHHYHIDRMLQNLKRNGVFEQLKGVIIGSFTDMQKGNPVYSETVEDIFKEHFNTLNIPVYSNFPSGHIDDNHSLIVGEEIEMKVTENEISIRSTN